MATTEPPQLRWRNDRLFYSGMGLFVAALVFAGFARSYYLSRWFELPAGTPEITPLLHFHGALCTGWLLLLIVQPLLIAGRKRTIHRRLGWFGAGVALLMVLTGNIAAIAAMHVGFIGLGDPFVFYAIPFFAINSFAVAVFLAFLWRERAETHKRLILLANVGLLNAAIARIPFDPLLAGAPYTFTFLPNVVTLAGILYDWKTRGRVHRVWIWGGLAMLASQILMFPLMGTEAWAGFARTMASLWIP